MFDVVIPAAGCGQRMGANSPKGLISLGTETVIQRQIRQLRSIFDCRIIVVGGYKFEKLHRTLPHDVEFVVNPRFADTNVADSIRTGLDYCKQGRSALILYGDLVFNMEAIKHLDPNISSVIVDETDKRDDEVGVAIDGDLGNVTRFSFGMPMRWSHIAMLAPKEKQLFINEVLPAHRFRYFGFEILNEVLSKGGRFKAIHPPEIKIIEIDSTRDIPDAVRLCDEDSV